MSEEVIRVISRQRVLESKCIDFSIEIARSRPSQVVHLLDKRLLSESCSNQVNRIDFFVEVGSQDLGVSKAVNNTIRFWRNQRKALCLTTEWVYPLGF